MHDQRNAYWEYRIEIVQERKEGKQKAVPGFAGHPVQQRRKCQTADGLRERKSMLPRPPVLHISMPLYVAQRPFVQPVTDSFARAFPVALVQASFSFLTSFHRNRH